MYVSEFSAHLGDGTASSTTVVCIPEQPAETLLSPVEEEAGSLPGRVNCNCLGKVLTRSVLLIRVYGRGADREAPCKFISAV